MASHCDELLSSVRTNKDHALAAFRLAMEADPEIKSVSSNNYGVVRLSGSRHIYLTMTVSSSDGECPVELFRDAIVCLSGRQNERSD